MDSKKCDENKKQKLNVLIVERLLYEMIYKLFEHFA